MEDLSFRALDITDRAHVAEVFQDDGGFSERVNGRPFIDADLEGFFDSVPPEVAAEKKLVLGAFQPASDMKREELVAVAHVVKDWPQQGIAYIGLLQVKASKQGRGIAREIHEALRRRIPDATVWRLAVVDSNSGAMGFWEKLGYQRTGEEKPWVSPTGIRRKAIIFELIE